MTTVERAFELAADHRFRLIDDVRRQLKAERHDLVDAHLTSVSLKRQLAQTLKMLD